MKAFCYSKYGQPSEVLALKTLEKPKPKKGEVLVQVYNTAINDYDWSMLRGKPYMYRLLFGVLRPKNEVPGMELSGVVEACGDAVKAMKVGDGVTGLQAGDAVMGDLSAHGFGSMAEYVCVPAEDLVLKPPTLSFEEAAALPHAGGLAYQALMEEGGMNKEENVSINGGGGGVGTYAIQLAKRIGCHVTAIDAQKKFATMRRAGADACLDYHEVNFTRLNEQYDLILDCKSNFFAGQYLGVLRKQGRYISIGGKLPSLLSIFVLGPLFRKLYKKRLKVLSLQPNTALEKLAEMAAKGELRSNIDGPYPFEEIPEKVEYFGRGDHLGKVIIQVCEK